MAHAALYQPAAAAQGRAHGASALSQRAARLAPASLMQARQHTRHKHAAPSPACTWMECVLVLRQMGCRPLCTMASSCPGRTSRRRTSSWIAL